MVEDRKQTEVGLSPDPGLPGPVHKRVKGPNRTAFDTTVHPDTIGYLDSLTSHYRVSRGQVIDKLVSALWYQLKSVKEGSPARHCLSGERCRYNLSDVPPVL